MDCRDYARNIGLRRGVLRMQMAEEERMKGYLF
jgi:hypothetical protein